MLVHRLEEQLDMIRQEIAMYNVQRKAQESETKATKEQLLDARTEIESIEFEHKQLYQVIPTYSRNEKANCKCL